MIPIRLRNRLEEKGVVNAARKARSYLTSPIKTANVDLDLLRDVSRFRKTWQGPMANAHPREPHRGELLVVSLSSAIYQVKLEIALAKALHLQGVRPHFLTVRRQQWPNAALRYFQSAGFGSVHCIEDFRADPQRAKELAAEVQPLLDGPLDWDRMRALTVGGTPIGQHVLSSLCRTFKKGRLDLTDPKYAHHARLGLVHAAEGLAIAGSIFDEIEPTVVMFNDKGYSRLGPIYDLSVARGINTIQFNYPFWDDALNLKRYDARTRRLHPFSLDGKTWDRVRKTPWTPEMEAALAQDFKDRYGGRWFLSGRFQHGKRFVPRDEVRRQVGLDPSKPTALLFSHILWDANLFYGEDLFRDLSDWLVQTARAAYENDRVNWIIKQHPSHVWKGKHDGSGTRADEVDLIRSELGAPPAHVRFVPPDTDINTLSFFEAADVCITVRGTVGIEAPSLGIPTITAGTGRYTGLGFTIDPPSAAQYLQVLASIEKTEPLTPEQILLAKKHAYALFLMRPFRYQTMRSVFKPFDEQGHPLDYNVELAARTSDEIRDARDLRLFAEWALDPTRNDYLDPDHTPREVAAP